MYNSRADSVSNQLNALCTTYIQPNVAYGIQLKIFRGNRRKGQINQVTMSYGCDLSDWLSVYMPHRRSCHQPMTYEFSIFHEARYAKVFSRVDIEHITQVKVSRKGGQH